MENNAVVLPELILQKACLSVLKLVKDDYTNAGSDKSNTLLYYFFKINENDENVELNTMNYYAQAVDLFTNREVQVNMGYNLTESNIPNIHILLPSESSKPLGIGADEGYQPTIELEVGDDIETRPLFTQSFDAQYQLLITSPNMFEVLLVYNLLKMGFLSIYENLEFRGLRNLKVGGQDLNLQTNLIPTHIFHRSFTVAFFYEINSPRWFKEKMIKTFTSSGIIN